jgi:hypothetical protein
MAKTETASLDKYVLRWMTEMGDRLGAERVGDALSGAILGVARTKAAVDRNVASLLSLARIPSRAEYQRMMTRVDVLQSRVIDLNRRLDAISHDLATTNGKSGRKKAVSGKTARASARPRRGNTARKRRT